MGSLFQSRASLDLKPGVYVELEYDVEEGVETCFVEVLGTSRKSITLKAPGTELRPVRLVPGLHLNVSYFDPAKKVFSSFETTVYDSRKVDFDIASPKDVKKETIADFGPGFSSKLEVSVEYRAMSTAHSQVATTESISPEGIVLRTNLPIPSGTRLKLEMDIPLPGGGNLKTEGVALSSHKDPENARKHLNLVEMNEISEAQRTSLLCFAIYYQNRLKREQEYSQADGSSF